MLQCKFTKTSIEMGDFKKLTLFNSINKLHNHNYTFFLVESQQCTKQVLTFLKIPSQFSKTKSREHTTRSSLRYSLFNNTHGPDDATEKITKIIFTENCRVGQNIIEFIHTNGQVSRGGWTRVKAVVVLQNQVDVMENEALEVIIFDGLSITHIHQFCSIECTRSQLPKATKRRIPKATKRFAVGRLNKEVISKNMATPQRNDTQRRS